MFDSHFDQASGLRNLKNTNPVRVISVASGKGGVGKTNLSVNLALSLMKLGKNVLLMDADLGLANIDVLLGFHPQYNISHVINGSHSLEDIIVTTKDGLNIVPASSGIKDMSQLTEAESGRLINAFSSLESNPDYLLIDTAAGISESVLTFSRAAQEIMVVVCDEPASITDAYALIKILNREYGVHRYHIVSNMVNGSQHGLELYKKLSKVTNRFLDVAINYMGAVPRDECLKKAVQRQKAVIEAYPRSKSAIAFKKIAHKADNWPRSITAGGHLEFFVERLVQVESGNRAALV